MWDKKGALKNSLLGTKLTHLEIFDQINNCIRQGHGSIAKSKLLSIKTKKLTTPEERIRYANLARRLSLSHEAIKLLHRYVRPKGRVKLVATEQELLEYAVALINVDASVEALPILKNLNTQLQPKVLLYTAFAHIEHWNYDEAATWLKKYIALSTISNYERLVAKANLCEALTYLKDPTAKEVIEETILEAKEFDFPIIVGHAHMTKCIHAIDNKEFEVAEKALKVAEKHFANLDTFEAFFVRKWRAILELYQDQKKGEAAIRAIRTEAKEKWAHWGTVRDCDFHEAVITKNEKLFKRLYFGTPYESYRKRLLQCWNVTSFELKNYVWHLDETKEKRRILELFSGNSPERASLLSAGKQALMLLGVLATDFYRPKCTAYIFSKLFAGEYYNPASSPARVRCSIFHLRKRLKKYKLPLQIRESNGTYVLGGCEPISLIIPAKINEVISEKTLQKADFLRTQLASHTTFTVQQACEALKLPRSSTNRLLRQSIEKGQIVRNGIGKSINYTWIEEKEFSKAA